jgi:starvation-inducible DNA-binding protein
LEFLRKSADLLKDILADEMTLYVKTRKAHWNITGEGFMELYKLFEGQYKGLESSFDEVAERIGKMGQPTKGTMPEFIKLTTLKEFPGKMLSVKETFVDLLHDHETVIIKLRTNIDDSAEKHQDSGTAIFLPD